LYRDFKKTSIANFFDIYWAWVGILVLDNKKGSLLGKFPLPDFSNKYCDAIVSLSFFSNS
jgi:hypothetical protein